MFCARISPDISIRFTGYYKQIYSKAVLSLSWFEKSRNQTSQTSHNRHCWIQSVSLPDLLTYHYILVAKTLTTSTHYHHIPLCRYHTYHYSYNDHIFWSSYRHMNQFHNLNNMHVMSNGVTCFTQHTQYLIYLRSVPSEKHNLSAYQKLAPHIFPKLEL